MASPFVLTAKFQLQEMCHMSIGWGDEIPEHSVKVWQKWILEIEQTHNVHIPGCYKTILFGEIRSCQLHAFSDASEKGFATVLYLRQVDNSG